MKILKSIYAFLRSNFLAGFFIAIPFAATIFFIIWLWGQIDEPLRQVFNLASKPAEMPWSRLFSGIRNSKYDEMFVPIIGLVLLLFAILFLGILARSIIGRMLLLGIENVVGRLPIVGMLYMSLKQLGEAFVSTDGESKFQRAVMVQFPYKGIWAIGFVTGRAPSFLPMTPLTGTTPLRDLLTVFVPTTPLPTQGFMLVVPEAETLELNMPVQEALKLVVSGGMIGPNESKRVRQQTEVTRTISSSLQAQSPLKPPPAVTEEPAN
ncbi:MAG TPA: DUF502 domain-containing protein [Planctomycetota bacterium]|nr:DUF502 domain-containing protein [Planctomycetota bacterium]